MIFLFLILLHESFLFKNILDLSLLVPCGLTATQFEKKTPLKFQVLFFLFKFIAQINRLYKFQDFVIFDEEILQPNKILHKLTACGKKKSRFKFRSV